MTDKETTSTEAPKERAVPPLSFWRILLQTAGRAVIFIVYLLPIIAIAGLLWLIREPLLTFVQEHQAVVFFSIGSFALIVLVAAMFRYLRTDDIADILLSFVLNVGRAQLRGAATTFEPFKDVLARVTNSTVHSYFEPYSEDADRPLIEHARLVEEVSSVVVSQLPSQLREQVYELFARDFKAESVIREAMESFKLISGRLEAATIEVRKRAQLNLILGTAISTAGLMFLVYFVVVFAPATTETWQETLVRSIPRLSLVLIIELLGYFFLGLYKFGTTELKYFQNEKTNVELWATAYLHAMRDGDRELSKDIIRKVLATERNFVLRKGERAAYAPEPTEDSGLTATDLRELLALVRKPKKSEA